MERLTTSRKWEDTQNDLKNELGYSHIWKRLNAIENILGDDYDLDRLRELVEKVWRGEWTHPHWSNDVSCADCKRCGKEAYHQLYHGVQDYYNFCPHCGALMTDEAV